MRDRTNPWTVLLILAIAACSVFGEEKAEPTITMRRDYCPMGFCPAYSLAIYPDGTVLYEGKLHVAVTGKQITKISPAEVQDLVRQFLAINYFSLESGYWAIAKPDGTFTVVSHAPTTYTSLTLDGITKSVVDHFGTPSELVELETQIDRVVNSHQWLHKDDDLKDWRTVAWDVYQGIKPGLNNLMQAAGRGDTARLRQEIRAGGDVNGADESGWTALMLAGAQCQLDTVKVLVEFDAGINGRDHHGDTALIGAAAAFCPSRREHQFAAILDVIRAGANVNAQNDQGQTALMLAGRSASPEAVEALLLAGADIGAKDRQGKTAVDYAQEANERLRNSSLTEPAQKALLLLLNASEKAKPLP